LPQKAGLPPVPPLVTQQSIPAVALYTDHVVPAAAGGSVCSSAYCAATAYGSWCIRNCTSAAGSGSAAASTSTAFLATS